jgi:streptogrisin C
MVGLAAGLAAALLSAPTGASAAPGIDRADPAAPTGAASPEVFAALQRDLGLTAAQVRERLAAEDVAIRMTSKITDQLGADLAGVWLDDQQQLVVGVTDASLTSQLRPLGVQPRVMDRSERQLNRIKSELDRADTPDPAQVTGWRVDVQTNTVVVTAKPGAGAAAAGFIRSAGLDRTAVRVEVSTESPRLLFDVRGGDAYFMNSGGRCSIGHAVNGGFVTAGHCGNAGTGTSGFNQVSQGVFQGSSFPGNDYAWVSVNSNWTPTPLVNRYNGTNVTVAGGQEAPVGASICRSGSTTGWHCGSIAAKNQTVNYPQGTVTGLTRTNVCAEPGDSGGSWMSGQQAQGVTSGGSGNCSSGGTTFYQPLQEILSRYGLTLVTSGGGGGDPPPPPPPGGCTNYDNVFTGSLSGTGDTEIEPNGTYFFWQTSGQHAGCLSGPSNADFDLYLQKWNGAWTTVASATSPDSQETLTYNGTSGYYRYIAHSFSGSGSYTVGINVP